MEVASETVEKAGEVELEAGGGREVAGSSQGSTSTKTVGTEEIGAWKPRGQQEGGNNEGGAHHSRTRFDTFSRRNVPGRQLGHLDCGRRRNLLNIGT